MSFSFVPFLPGAPGNELSDSVKVLAPAKEGGLGLAVSAAEQGKFPALHSDEHAVPPRNFK
jgi:hypothetical protein